MMIRILTVHTSYLLSLPFFGGVILFGQGYRPAEERGAYDYFDRLGDKSYYQQQKIDFMKDEMNDYSRRLHSLQEKFNQKFFGSQTGSEFNSPFSNNPSNTERSRKSTRYSKVDSTDQEKQKEVSGNSQKLAFEVNQPSQNQGIGKTKELQFTEASSESMVASPPLGFARHNNLGGYLILRPGVVLPYHDKTDHFAGGKTKHREYKPGPAVSISGGYRWKNLLFGAGVLYRRNKHDSHDSYEEVSGVRHAFVSGSKSQTVAGFVEFGYDHSFTERVKFLGTLNLGYGVSIVEDYAASANPLAAHYDRKRLDPTFFGSLGLAVGLQANDHFTFLLGYRYLYEDEVPAHGLEIGLNGNF